MPKKTKTVLLIDGDVFVYQIGLAAEKAIHWGDDLWTLHADFAECKDALAHKLEVLVKNLEADSCIFALSCPTESGFRRELCSTYKANRAGVRKPIVHGPLRELLIADYDTIIRDKLEADDVLGVLATTPNTGERRIIVSVDKDYRGVPCLFYRTSDELPAVTEISCESAIRFHASQTLSGDRVDGYTGIPGCGPKTADKLLVDVPTEELWPAIVKAYAEAGLGEELALTNARLARILQHGDYNTKTGAIKLWQPNQSRKTSQAINSSAVTASKPETSLPSSMASTNGPTPAPSVKRRTTKGAGQATASTA